MDDSKHQNAKSDVESGIYERYYSIKPKDVVLDLGANVGYFTEMASRKVGDVGLVVAFEPHPENFIRLLERAGSLPNVWPVHAGAYNEDSRIPFYHCEENPGAHSFNPEDCRRPLKPIQVVDIGRWLSRYGIRPNFVKMDVEGHELEIVPSLIQSEMRRCPMAIEIHSGPLYWIVKKQVESAGYHFFPEQETVGVCYANL